MTDEDAAIVENAITDTTQPLSAGLTGRLLRELRESFVGQQRQIAAQAEQITELRKRLDAASKAFVELRAEVKKT